MKAEKIESCLMDYGYTSNEDWEEYHELVRLATIGRYTKMAFKETEPEFVIGLDVESIGFRTVEELIEWGESQEGEDERG